MTAKRRGGTVSGEKLDGDGDDGGCDDDDPDEPRRGINGRKEEALEAERDAGERKKSRRTRSDRDVRSDLVAESNLAK